LQGLFDLNLSIKNSQSNIDYKTLYEQERKVRLAQEKVIDELQIVMSKLQLQVLELQKFIFTGKQEKFKPVLQNAAQSSLFDVAPIAEVVVNSETEVAAHTKKKTAVRINHKGRNPLPDHLRREVEVIEPTEDVSGLTPVGVERTETLEYQQAEIYVKVIERPEYIKPNEDGTGAKRIIAPLEDKGFSKCIAGITLLTYLIISKYVDHLPIYRLQQIFKRDKVNIDEATIYNWLKRACHLLEPLYQEHRKSVLQTRYLSADETTIAVLDEEKKGGTHQGYFWSYYDTHQRLVLFEYQKGRAALYPKQVLENYKGYLLSDGYESYSQFDTYEHIHTHNCWAHARRKFFDAQSFDQAKCEAVLTLIAELYNVEREYKESDAEQRQQARQQVSVPILNKIYETLSAFKKDTIPSSPLDKAIEYTLKRWTKLCLYTTDGNLQIDNNLIENSIRPIALGRKNYLFAGSHEAAQRSAMLYSLIYTCKEHGVNPTEWLEDVLNKINNTKLSNLHLLLPQNYKTKS
jgi:transposase